MLVLWSNCNSLMSGLVPMEGRKTVNLDGFKNAGSLMLE